MDKKSISICLDLCRERRANLRLLINEFYSQFDGTNEMTRYDIFYIRDLEEELDDINHTIKQLFDEYYN